MTSNNNNNNNNNLKVSPIFNIKQETLRDEIFKEIYNFDMGLTCEDLLNEHTDEILKIFDKHLTILAQSNRGKGICINTINKIKYQLLQINNNNNNNNNKPPDDKIKYTIDAHGYRTKL